MRIWRPGWALPGDWEGQRPRPRSCCERDGEFSTTASLRTWSLQADRQNGVNEQELIISQPNFFCPNSLAACPAINTLQGTSVPTIYQIAPNLRAPMLMQTAVSVERQLTKAANVSISYLNSRGWRQLVTDNVNSPVLRERFIPTSAATEASIPTE